MWMMRIAPGKDELTLLAYGNPAFIPNLQQCFQEEKEEQEKLQVERAFGKDNILLTA